MIKAYFQKSNKIRSVQRNGRHKIATFHSLHCLVQIFIRCDGAQKMLSTSPKLLATYTRRDSPAHTSTNLQLYIIISFLEVINSFTPTC